MNFNQFKEKLSKLPGILAVVYHSDIVINANLDIYLKRRDEDKVKMADYFDKHGKEIVIRKKPRLLLSERLVIPCFPIESYIENQTNMAIETIFAYENCKKTEANVEIHKEKIESEILKTQWNMIATCIGVQNERDYDKIKNSLLDYRMKNKLGSFPEST